MAFLWISLQPARRTTRAAENPVVQAGTLAADLVRRDFTINSMAFDLMANELIDHHNGLEDLASGNCAFCAGSVRDPTRVIRAARYAARLVPARG